MEFCRKSPQPSCFQLGNWNSNPPSFPTVNNHTGFLPHRPTLALGSLSSTHQGRQRGLHKLCCTVCNKNDSGYKQTFFFPPVSEQKLHFPQLIQCYWSTLLPHKNHIWGMEEQILFQTSEDPKSEHVKLTSSFWGPSRAWNSGAGSSREYPGVFSSYCSTSLFTTKLSASGVLQQKQMAIEKIQYFIGTLLNKDLRLHGALHQTI